MHISERRFYLSSLCLPVLVPLRFGLTENIDKSLIPQLSGGSLDQFLMLLIASSFVIPVYIIFVIVFLILVRRQSMQQIKGALFMSPIAFISLTVAPGALAHGIPIWKITVAGNLFLYITALISKNTKLSGLCYIGMIALTVFSFILLKDFGLAYAQLIAFGYFYVLPVFIAGVILKKLNYLYAS